ncbi:hypothetical protein [Streptomyces sp. NBRC 110465]|uniref:hypothetical protein n=1 Tax=Streptomyces sp. NBRC 110465 TaxID=1897621 RepID=UPI000932D05F|nr:hypothetical protein [Streptomyces sp. NBRC 110465]
MGDPRVPLQYDRIDPEGLAWLQKVGDVISDSEGIVGVATGCIAGLGAASETGIIQAAGVFGGGIGAAVGSCAVGGAMGYAGMDIISYG